MPPAKVRGVPVRRWEACTFESFDLSRNTAMRPALERVKAVASGREWCAFLAGDPGNGKTHLAIAAMHAFDGQRAYFWKVPDFLEWLRVTAYGKDIGVLRALADYVEQDFLLVLDDLGVQKNTEWGDEQMYRILDSRYDRGLPTIVTTNQPMDVIDERLRSRFAEGLVVCEGADLRRQKGA